MTKDVFLSMIEHSLTDAGMPKEKVDESIAHFNTSFSKMSNEEFEKKVSQLGGIEVISERVVSNYKKSVRKKTRMEQDENEETDDAAGNAEDADEAKKSAEVGDANEIVEASAESKPEQKQKQSISELLTEDDDTVKPKPRKKTPVPQNDATKNGKSKNGKTKNKNSASNIQPGVFAATPVAALLMIIAVACFAFLYGAVGAIVVVFATLLVLLSASGTALAIVAIIYGITQLTVSKGAGLYEIGIGIVAGGVTLFFGILMYNFIVRLAPFLFKKMLVLFKFVFRKIKLLFSVIKEACDKR